MAPKYWIMTGHYPGFSGSGLHIVTDDGAGDFQVFQAHQCKKPWRTAPRLPSGDVSAALTAAGAKVEDIAEAKGLPGEFHARMWRPQWCPRFRTTDEVAFRSAQGAALNLFAEMKTVFRYVEPAGNLSAFGHEIRQLLILACTEVEAQCKEVLRANHYQRADRKERNVPARDWKQADYYKTARPLNLSGFRLRVRGHPAFPSLAPFDTWGGTKFAALPWYAAYNKVKHDREQEFRSATLEHMVTAMAAVYALITAQFGQFGNHYSFGYSELDAFDLAAPRPAFTLAEHYLPPELIEGIDWHAVDHRF